MAEELYRARSCFVCGTDNPGGLNLAPQRDGKKVFVRFTPGDVHRGFSKAVHGGITASLLDEVVGVAAGQAAGGKCATVELTVTYRRPVLVGVEVRAEGWPLRRQGRFMLAKGQVLDPAGKVLATCRGRFLPLDEKQASRFVGDGD
jgi:uncharacterized protein (TIGR00369 family)